MRSISKALFPGLCHCLIAKNGHKFSGANCKCSIFLCVPYHEGPKRRRWSTNSIDPHFGTGCETPDLLPNYSQRDWLWISSLVGRGARAQLRTVLTAALTSLSHSPRERCRNPESSSPGTLSTGGSLSKLLPLHTKKAILLFLSDVIKSLPVK